MRHQLPPHNVGLFSYRKEFTAGSSQKDEHQVNCAARVDLISGQHLTDAIDQGQLELRVGVQC